MLFKPTFVRQYKKLDGVLQAEVKAQINLLKDNPRNPILKAHKLGVKLKGFWSFSVTYKHRIVFSYEAKNQIVLLAFGDHSIYRSSPHLATVVTTDR